MLVEASRRAHRCRHHSGLVAVGCVLGAARYVKGAADLFQIGLFLGGILCIIVEMLLLTVGLHGVAVAAMLYSPIWHSAAISLL